MTRQWYIHQDSYIYIEIRIFTSRFVYIHQDLYIYIKIRTYTSRFVYIHQDSYIYIKIRMYIARFVYIHQDSYIYIKICIFSLRFVQLRHKGKYDRWIDYRVLKRRSKNGSKWESHVLLASPCLQSHDRGNNSSKQCWRRVVESFFFLVLVHSSLLCAIHEWIMEAIVEVERKGD